MFNWAHLLSGVWRGASLLLPSLHQAPAAPQWHQLLERGLVRRSGGTKYTSFESFSLFQWRKKPLYFLGFPVCTLSVSISHTTSSSVTESPTAKTNNGRPCISTFNSSVIHYGTLTPVKYILPMICWLIPTFLPPHIPLCDRFCECRSFDCDNLIPCTKTTVAVS